VRLVTYVGDGTARVGVRIDGGIVDAGYADMIELIRDGREGLERAARALESGDPVEGARPVAPLPRPGKILCSGVNYASHKEENPDAVMPEEPFFFSKLPTAVIGPGEPIVIPREGTQADWEVELALVVGRRASRVSVDEALDHVFGWTILDDVSARDIQFKDSQITLGKGVDTFSPLGPEIVTSDEIGDWSTLNLASFVNGERMQSTSAGEMLFSPARLLAFLTEIVTLEPGDVVTTGTPAGVGCFRNPPVYLKPGDEVTVEVDRIGRLTNPVEAGW
jgi:2-keto-4-pentenoate hydratase/2-oxohepta-3-ene-1,7-dioic acid hydratase in catechol pathway